MLKKVVLNGFSDHARYYDAVEVCKRHGFEGVPDHDYSRPDPSHTIQCRDKDWKPSDREVRKYVRAIQRKELMPPIIVTKDGFIVDGNTRTMAYEIAKIPRVWAYVLDISWEGLATRETAPLYAVAAEMNALNGNPNSYKDARKAVEIMHFAGEATVKKIAETTKLREQEVDAIIRELKSQERASSLGIENGSLPKTHKRVLGTRDAVNLNDRPYVALYELARDSGMSAKDLRSLLQGITQVKSDDEKLDLISKERSERREQIKDFRQTNRRRPVPSGRLRQSLGFLFSQEQTLSLLVEKSPDLCNMHLDACRKAIALLEEVARRQYELCG